jgi:ribosomal protein S7
MARPKNTELAAVKNKNKGIIGRPKGDKAIIDEYKARMLNSPKSAKVLESILNAALNDDHKNQAAAWKLVIDRIAPLSSFEAVKAGGQTPQISINITGLTSPTVAAEEVVYDISDVEAKSTEDEEDE